MCCTAKSRVNDIGEKFFCKYGDTDIGMYLLMDGIPALETQKTSGKKLEIAGKQKH